MDLISVFRVLIPVYAAVCVAEVIASVIWWPFYFRRGVQIYRREIHGELESRRELSDIAACSNTGFLFRTMNAQEVIFRDPLIRFSFRAPPLIHGLLSYNGPKFELLGLANWTPVSFAILVVFFGVFGVVLTGFAGLVVLVVPAMFLTSLAWLYQTQKSRLDDLVDEITANLKTKNPVP